MASSEASVRPIASRSVSEQATAELRRSILSGALAPGQKFSLREIADMLEVSFIPVRDALRALEAEGLIVTKPGRSAIVAPLDLDDLHAIYRLRRTLEPEIAGRACLLLPDEELDRLEHCATQFGGEEQSINEMYENHHAFHLALFSPATTTWDVRILTTLWRAAERYIRIGFSFLDPDPHEHRRREHVHKELVTAFRQRDSGVAAKAINNHLSHNEQTALQALQTHGSSRA